jgi:o-succinylbenzoate---CoA ligase
MTDWLALAARRRPDHPAVLAGGRSVTYAELDARAGELAATLEPGRPVPIAVRPGIEFAELLHATWRAGAVALPLDPAARRPGLDGLRRDGRTALVIHTSGTTGEPIPVELTLENLEASARASADAFGTQPGDRWLCPLPLNHVGGLSVLVRSAVNATTAVLHERFEAKRVKATLEAGEATLASLVPTMLARLRDAGLRRAPGLRAIALGGGPMPAGLLEWAAGAGIPVTPVYGMTETASQVVAGIPGRALTGVELAVTGEGEILVRGPMVARASVDREGWLHTGDRGRLDADGLLQVEGRIKELIVTGGENVAPVEVEQVLLRHPQVVDAGVAGRPDPEWGEAVVAFVVLRERVPAEELRSWCRARLPGFKVPKRIEPVAELPRNANGKLLRDRLPASRVRRP